MRCAAVVCVRVRTCTHTLAVHLFMYKRHPTGTTAPPCTERCATPGCPRTAWHAPPATAMHHAHPPTHAHMRSCGGGVRARAAPCGTRLAHTVGHTCVYEYWTPPLVAPAVHVYTTPHACIPPPPPLLALPGRLALPLPGRLPGRPLAVALPGRLLEPPLKADDLRRGSTYTPAARSACWGGGGGGGGGG